MNIIKNNEIKDTIKRDTNLFKKILSDNNISTDRHFQCLNHKEHKNNDNKPAMKYWEDKNILKCFVCDTSMDIFSYIAYKERLDIVKDFKYILDILIKEGNYNNIPENINNVIIREHKISNEILFEPTSKDLTFPKYPYKPEIIKELNVKWYTKDKFKIIEYSYYDIDNNYLGSKHVYPLEKPEGSNRQFWNKRNLKNPIYLINKIKDYDTNKPLFICEGEPDTIILYQNDYQSIGISGKNGLSKEKAENLRELIKDFKEVIFCFDFGNEKEVIKSSERLNLTNIRTIDWKVLNNDIKLVKEYDIRDLFKEKDHLQLFEKLINKTDNVNLLDFKEVKKDTKRLLGSNKVKNYINDTYDFKFNTITKYLEFKIKEETEFNILNDIDLNTILDEIRDLTPCTKTYLTEILYSKFVEQYNPFINYFDYIKTIELEPDKDYIEELINCIKIDCEPEDEKHYKEISKIYLTKYLIGVVKCSTDKNEINDNMLIIKGNQGIGKNTFINKLLPKELDTYIYTGNIYSFDEKDSKMFLEQTLFINIDELDTINKYDISRLKSLISNKSGSYRPPYGRQNIPYYRNTSFIGSINNDIFLTDHTGNRRFLCIPVLDMDLNKLKEINIDKAYRYILKLIDEGETQYFTKKDIENINEYNKDFETTDVLEIYVNDIFDVPDTNSLNIDILPAHDILAILYNEFKDKIKIDNATLQRLGKVLTKLKFVKSSKREGNKTIKGYKIKSKISSFDINLKAKL